jgi:hypothetical protein
MIDGGTEYIRCSANGDEKFISVYANEDFEKVRKYAYRITRGEDGARGPYSKICLADLTDIHLESVILHLEDTLNDYDKEHNTHFRLLKMEKAYRISKQIWTLSTSLKKNHESLLP